MKLIKARDSLGERAGDINMLDWFDNGFDVEGKEEVYTLGKLREDLDTTYISR